MRITVETDDTTAVYDDVLDFFLIGTNVVDKVKPMDFQNWSCNRRKLIGALYYHLKQLEAEDFADTYKLKRR